MLTESERSRLRPFFRKEAGSEQHLTCHRARQIAADTDLPLRMVEYCAGSGRRARTL